MKNINFYFLNMKTTFYKSLTSIVM